MQDRKHNHYFKDVQRLQYVDLYRVHSLFNVTDPCLQHAIKKLLVAGGRGAGKDKSKDIQEAVDSLVRWQEMAQEDERMLATPVKGIDVAGVAMSFQPSTLDIDLLKEILANVMHMGTASLDMLGKSLGRARYEGETDPAYSRTLYRVLAQKVFDLQTEGVQPEPEPAPLNKYGLPGSLSRPVPPVVNSETIGRDGLQP